MPRLSTTKAAELEAFWRAHLDGWRCSDLNRREYCEIHGLPLKRFGNWRAKLRHENAGREGKLLYRRGGGLKHRLKHLGREIPPAPSSYIPSGRSGSGRRRNFSLADKKRMVEEACREGGSISSVAKKYGVGPRLLFHWKQELGPAVVTEPAFLPVTIKEPPEDASANGPSLLSDIVAPSLAAPVIVERSMPGIEVELVGGRRVRFERDVDPETIRRLVTLLEGNSR